MTTMQYHMLPQWLLPLGWCNTDGDKVHRSVTGLCVNIGFHFVGVDHIGMGFLGCMVSTFVRTHQPVFQRAWTILYSPHYVRLQKLFISTGCYWFPFVPILAILVSVGWHLTVVLIHMIPDESWWWTSFHVLTCHLVSSLMETLCKSLSIFLIGDFVLDVTVQTSSNHHIGPPLWVLLSNSLPFPNQ